MIKTICKRGLGWAAIGTLALALAATSGTVLSLDGGTAWANGSHPGSSGPSGGGGGSSDGSGNGNPGKSGPGNS